MPIYDVNGDEIQYHDNFPNKIEVANLEIGAGCGHFGKKYFSQCYLTEMNEDIGDSYTHYTKLNSYQSDTDCHYIDYFCSYQKARNISNREFDNIICCNPYGYGFNNEKSAYELLDNLGSILATNGTILIIAHHSNGWGKYRNAERRLEMVSEELAYNFKLGNLESMDSNHKYRNDYKYYKVLTREETRPNQVYRIIKEG